MLVVSGIARGCVEGCHEPGIVRAGKSQIKGPQGQGQKLVSGNAAALAPTLVEQLGCLSNTKVEYGWEISLRRIESVN